MLLLIPLNKNGKGPLDLDFERSLHGSGQYYFSLLSSLFLTMMTAAGPSNESPITLKGLDLAQWGVDADKNRVTINLLDLSEVSGLPCTCHELRCFLWRPQLTLNTRSIA